MIELAKNDVKQYFKDGRYIYHSLEHSISVYDEVTKIALAENINGKELELLQIAALYHDTGYAQNPTTHEQISAEIASKFLSAQMANENDIAIVQNLILATKMNTKPSNDIEGIIKDADLAHLGKKNFLECSLKLKQEKESLIGQSLDEKTWTKSNVAFLEEHKWHNKSAKKMYNKQKKENLSLEKKKLKAIKKAKEKNKPEKGVETMYRVALRNHNQLSKIADNKANILLSITAIMLSLILSNLATKIDSNPRFLIPTILIIAVNIVTMIFAIMATRPKVSSAPYTRERFLDNKVNILFFGNFYKMPLDEFEWAMNHLQESKALLYNSMSKDLYFLGKVLAKKYRYLEIAYFVFMIGLIISTIAFVWSII
jgi:HD superfamily phosphodiesterase